MKKIKLLHFLFLIFSFPLFSQSFSIGVGPGFSFIQGNTFYTRDLGFAGYYPVNGDYANFLGMKFNSEFNLNGIVAYSFYEVPISVYTQLAYIIMRGNGNAELSPDVNHPEIPLENYDITTKMNVLSISLGSKYTFSNWDIKPILFFEVQMNNFSDITIEAKNNNQDSEFLSTKGIQRIGLATGIGLNYNLYLLIDVEMMIKYNEYNLFNKRDGEDNLKSIGFNLLFLYSFN